MRATVLRWPASMRHGSGGSPECAARVLSGRMKLHEYQSKELFEKFGIPVPKGRVTKDPEEARKIAAELGGKSVVKAQVLMGGRGKAGGVKLFDNPDDAAAF